MKCARSPARLARLHLLAGAVLGCGSSTSGAENIGPGRAQPAPPADLAPDPGAAGDHPPDEQGPRAVAFTYSTKIGPIEPGKGPVHVFVPIAGDNDQQKIVDRTIQASIPGDVEHEDRHGNRFWHGTVAVSNGKTIAITIDYDVERRVERHDPPRSLPRSKLTAAELRKLAKYLAADASVPVGHRVLDPILAEIREGAGSDDPARKARAIYDWVVDNIEYKKVGTGWGNGDTFWACSTRYGNCTDFHALYISLARTEGIPARFEIGFPLPEDRPAGAIEGYHCWLHVYLPDRGWLPVDASEAARHPEKRELLYASHPADRIQFTTGRDLRLGPEQRAGPLNYFIYPHVEVAGTRYEGPIDNVFSFSDRGR